MIKEKIDRMNENLERLEKKYTNKEILMMSGAGEQNIQENTIKTYIRNGGRRTDCACIEWGPGEDNDPDGEEIGVLMSIIRTIGPVSTSSMMLFIKNRFPEITVNILNDKLCEMLKQGLIQTISFSQ
jgi:hypothetical protein